MNYSLLIKQIAADLNISQSTVVRALNPTGLVKTTTMESIVRYAEAHYPGYKDLLPVKKKCKTIAIIMPSKPNYFWNQAQAGARDALNSYDPGTIRLHTMFYSYEKTDEESSLFAAATRIAKCRASHGNHAAPGMVITNS